MNSSEVSKVSERYPLIIIWQLIHCKVHLKVDLLPSISNYHKFLVTFFLVSTVSKFQLLLVNETMNLQKVNNLFFKNVFSDPNFIKVLS